MIVRVNSCKKDRSDIYKHVLTSVEYLFWKKTMSTTHTRAHNPLYKRTYMVYPCAYDYSLFREQINETRASCNTACYQRILSSDGFSYCRPVTSTWRSSFQLAHKPRIDCNFILMNVLEYLSHSSVQFTVHLTISTFEQKRLEIQKAQAKLSQLNLG